MWRIFAHLGILTRNSQGSETHPWSFKVVMPEHPPPVPRHQAYEYISVVQDPAREDVFCDQSPSVPLPPPGCEAQAAKRRAYIQKLKEKAKAEEEESSESKNEHVV